MFLQWAHSFCSIHRCFLLKLPGCTCMYVSIRRTFRLYDAVCTRKHVYTYLSIPTHGSHFSSVKHNVGKNRPQTIQTSELWFLSKTSGVAPTPGARGALSSALCLGIPRDRPPHNAATPKIGNSRKRNPVFSFKDMHYPSVLTIFVVTNKVTNFLPKLLDTLLFSMEKNWISIFWIPYFRVLSTMLAARSGTNSPQRRLNLKSSAQHWVHQQIIKKIIK